jgi:hypothetical protein
MKTHVSFSQYETRFTSYCYDAPKLTFPPACFLFCVPESRHVQAYILIKRAVMILLNETVSWIFERTRVLQPDVPIYIVILNGVVLEYV